MGGRGCLKSRSIGWIRDSLILAAHNISPGDPFCFITFLHLHKYVVHGEYFMNTDCLPLVSIIVPVYNGEHRLPTLLSALHAQTYPNLEILIVDNNSTDNTAAIIQADTSVRYVWEGLQQGCSAARNAALQVAKGEILAFTDDDCIPDPEWVSEGVRSLGGDYHLAGGEIQFFFSKKPGFAEWLDACQFLNQANYVSSKFAVTANLFVRRQVFEQIGSFDGTVVSGGDVVFCRRACAHGFDITYAGAARISHPTRQTLKSLRDKAWRTGYGAGQLSAQDKGKFIKSYLSLNDYRLPRLNFRRLRDLGINLSYRQKLLSTIVNYSVVTLPRNIGCIFGYLDTRRELRGKQYSTC